MSLISMHIEINFTTIVYEICSHIYHRPLGHDGPFGGCHNRWRTFPLDSRCFCAAAPAWQQESNGRNFVTTGKLFHDRHCHCYWPHPVGNDNPLKTCHIDTKYLFIKQNKHR